MERFGLSEVQANAILEMQLRRLAALERQKIEDEYVAIIQKIAELEDILANPKRVLQIIRDELGELLRHVDAIVLNDEEARMLTGETNLIRAARKVLAMGPRFVILKKGEHGAFVIGGEDLHFSIPAYPVDEVVDPTGAGDSFAGGFMGYVAAEDKTDDATLRQAMLYGTVTASFACPCTSAASRTAPARWRRVRRPGRSFMSVAISRFTLPGIATIFGLSRATDSIPKRTTSSALIHIHDGILLTCSRISSTS